MLFENLLFAMDMIFEYIHGYNGYYIFSTVHNDGILTSGLRGCQDEICTSFWIDFKNLDIVPTARQEILDVY